MQDQPEQQLITRVSIRQAAKILGVSMDTVRRRISDGTIQAERVFPNTPNAPIRIRLDELERHTRPIPTLGSLAQGGAE